MIEAELQVTPKTSKVLDFDIETVAASYGDWPSSHIMAIAWSWLGQDIVVCKTILDYAKNLPAYLEMQFLGCRPMLEEFGLAYAKADVVTGHNIGRFDLGEVNAAMARLQLPLLERKPIIDTMNLKRPLRGFKKGQDNMAVVLDVPAEKKPMNWAQWMKAYATKGWPEIRERCAGDVVQHKLLLARLEELEYLR